MRKKKQEISWADVVMFPWYSFVILAISLHTLYDKDYLAGALTISTMSLVFFGFLLYRMVWALEK